MQKKDKEKKVAIIIVNWNKKELIDDCLNSLAKFTDYKNYEVIVSDNGSTDGAAELIKKKYKWVDLLENGKNLGFALANNVAFDYSIKKYDPDYFLLLNNDTRIIKKDWLKKLVETAESDSKIGLVNGVLIFPDGRLQFFVIKGKTYYLDENETIKINKDDEKELNKIQEVKIANAGCLLIKKEVIDKIGIFDKFVPYYGEEIDYCERVRKNGFKIMYDPRVVIIHIKGQTVNARKIIKDWYIMKKQSIKVELLNYPLRKILYWWFVHFSAVFLSKRGKEISFNWNFPRRFLLLIKAYLDNLPHIPEYLHKRKHRDEKIWWVG